MSVCLCYVCSCPQRPEDGVWSPGVGVIGIYELPSVGFGTQTLTFYKSSKCSWSVTHLPNPVAARLSAIFQSPSTQFGHLVCLVGASRKPLCWIALSVWTWNIKHQWSSWAKRLKLSMALTIMKGLFDSVGDQSMPPDMHMAGGWGFGSPRSLGTSDELPVP